MAGAFLGGMTETRISQLLDMLICHVIHGRTIKALKIAQYLRSHFGMVLVSDLDHMTGYRKVQP